jgi:hypothetical protein
LAEYPDETAEIYKARPSTTAGMKTGRKKFFKKLQGMKSEHVMPSIATQTATAHTATWTLSEVPTQASEGSPGKNQKNLLRMLVQIKRDITHTSEAYQSVLAGLIVVGFVLIVAPIVGLQTEANSAIYPGDGSSHFRDHYMLRDVFVFSMGIAVVGVSLLLTSNLTSTCDELLFVVSDSVIDVDTPQRKKDALKALQDYVYPRSVSVKLSVS